MSAALCFPKCFFSFVNQIKREEKREKRERKREEEKTLIRIRERKRTQSVKKCFVF